ncbi:MAG TPA: adenylosuccinate lyase [Solirubrobacteraceae bacterium]|nr:adenylosuccinate lyase [Solirubrobacteraceae bacterium]
MIERYTRPELGAIWTDAARMEAWRRVEVAACEELPRLLAETGTRAKGACHPASVETGMLAERGMRAGGECLPASLAGECPPASVEGGGPTPAELEAIRAATFTVKAVSERERTTDHDVAAFVDVLSANAGEAGRWIHYGLTSSDVLDTALALQLRAAGEIVLAGARQLVAALAARAREHVDTVCIGRTHGVHAEPTTFGVKLAGFAFEAHRNAERLERAFAQAAVGALSGAVGTYAATSPRFEERVLARLGLEREPVSTQVVARDRHAELLQAIALAAAGMERFATEVRHLQRTEVREVEEPFAAGQKGSSAMPHKRNPIKSEQITGLARVVRGNAQAGLENVALWHERDISHSSVERVVLADSTILIDYLQQRAIKLVEGMVVHPERMRANLDLTHGAIFSQALLLALVQEGRGPEGQLGMKRDEAYRIVQRTAQEAWDTGTPLRELIAVEPAASPLDPDAIFDYSRYIRYAREIVARLDEIV